MQNNLEKAKALLESGGCTLALFRGDECVTSSERGIKALLRLYRGGQDFSSFSAADRVVGKAAAFLYVLLGIREVYAPVISEGALAVLEEYGIQATYDTCVKVIMNRAGTGLCPMEQAVLEIAEPKAALAAVTERLQQLKG